MGVPIVPPYATEVIAMYPNLCYITVIEFDLHVVVVFFFSL